MAKCYTCKNEYESQDPEDIEGYGYCAKCKEEKKALEQKLDSQPRVNTPKKEYRWIPANVPGGKLYLE